MQGDKIPWINIDEETREEITEKLKQFAEKRKDIKILILYGSVLQRNYIRDIDIAVYVEENERDLLKAEFEIEEELEKIPKMPVDVRVINEAPPWFIKEIVKKGKILKGKQLTITLYKQAIEETKVIKTKIKTDYNLKAVGASSSKNYLNFLAYIVFI